MKLAQDSTNQRHILNSILIIHVYESQTLIWNRLVVTDVRTVHYIVIV